MWMVEATAPKGCIVLNLRPSERFIQKHIKDRENVLMTILNAGNPIVIDSMLGTG